MIIANRRTSADGAYALLRSQAATTTCSLIEAAAAVVAPRH
jgi:AmiR/NasT family two-component response regulator